MSVTAVRPIRQGILKSSQQHRAEFHSTGALDIAITANQLTGQHKVLNSAHRPSPAQYARTLNSMHQSSNQLVGCCR